MRKLFLAAMLVATTMATSARSNETVSDGAVAADPASSRLWSRISESLSPFIVGERLLPAAVGRLRNGDNCGRGTGYPCEVEGEDGVLHILDDDDVLRIKEIELDPPETSPRAIRALGIGVARSRSEVLRKVKSFAPELSFVCADHDEYVEDEGSTRCEAFVGVHGSVTLIFSYNDRLWFVRQTTPVPS